MPYLGIGIDGCKIKVRLKFNNADPGSYYVVPLYYVDGLGYVKIPHTFASIVLTTFDRSGEKEIEMKIAGFPLMGETGGKSILLLIQHSRTGIYVSEKEIPVYFSSSPFEHFSISLKTVEEDGKRYALVIVFYTMSKYKFDEETPFGVFTTLLKEEDEYGSKKVWSEGWIETTNLYLIYDRRKGPDKGESLLVELLETTETPYMICGVQGIKSDIGWGVVNENIFANRIQGAKALDFLLRTVMSLTHDLPYIGPIFKYTDPIMELLKLTKEREIPQLTRIYPQFFDYRRYSIEPYIFIGMPECGGVRWVGITTTLKFTPEYDNSTITVIVLINDYYYYDTSIRLNVGS